MATRVIPYLVKDISTIIKGCLRNDRRSQSMLYEYCFDTMMAICMRYERDENRALEVLNNAFLKILQNLKSYDPAKDFQPWICRITVNEAIDKYRKKLRRRELFEAEKGVENMEGLAGMSLHGDWEYAQYLEQLLETLPLSEKTVFNLFAIDGYSHKEIGAMLEITERSSIRHLTNARRKLQEMLPMNELGIRKA